MKFIQYFNDVCNEVWFDISDDIIYISFPSFINLCSSRMSVLSKCTINIPGNTGPRGDPMGAPSFC